MSDPLGLNSTAEYLETLMLDECEIFDFLNKEDFDEGTRNEATGEYDTSEPPKSYLYSGKCMIYSRAPQSQPVEEGGQAKYRQEWGASLPRSFDEKIGPQTILQVTGIHFGGDQSLVGRRFTIEAVDGGTFIVTREMNLVAKEPGRR